MSRVHGNDDLKLMNEYDFKTPINASVIICDDEEENSPIVEEKNDNDVSSNLDDIVSGIINDMCKVTNKDNHDTTSTVISTANASDNHNNTDIAEYAEGHNINPAVEVSNETINKNNQSSSESNETINKDNQSLNKNQSETNFQEKRSHPLVSDQQTAYSYKEDDTNQVNKSIQALLDTVSTHMIFIMKAFEEYKAISSRTSDKAVLQTAWKRYYDIKCRFYYLSFSAISNIMIPRENDTDFLENFIENTIKLAKIRHWYFKSTEMALLCKKMCSWVKSRMQYPVLTDLLRTESTTNSCREQRSCMTNNVDSTCVFKSGPAGRELTITVNPTVAEKNESANQLWNKPHKLPSIQNTLPPDLRNNTNYYMPEIQSYRTCKQIPTHPYQPKQYRRSNPASKVPPEIYHHYNHPTSAPQTRHPLPYYLPQTNNQLLVPTASVINTHNTETQLTNPGYYNNFLGNQEQLEVSRTLSRDSGFMSPLSSASNDSTCSPRLEYDSSASVTPMITHVTSLNPSVAFISDGVCHVCGKLTKQKCLGCYKCYYCSHQCQAADWRYHFSICK